MPVFQCQQCGQHIETDAVPDDVPFDCPNCRASADVEPRANPIDEPYSADGPIAPWPPPAILP